MTGRLTLLLSSPRIVPGVLSREAWRALESADAVLGRADEPQVVAVVDAGLAVEFEPEPEGSWNEATARRRRRLVDRAAAEAEIVWVVSSDGDPGLTDAVAAEVSRRQEAPEVEVVLGSHDAPGARLLDLVAVMDRLRSPGGCPWDAEQTHTSLVPFLIEEAHEAAEALESGDRDHIVEELGDVLLQVVFHARVGEEDARAPFDVDDVAAAIVAKLVRRHPHVFADGAASTPAEVEASWDAIKAAERAGTTAEGAGLLHGIPAGMPVLARATKIVSRVRRAGQEDLLTAAGAGDEPGARLLALVTELTASGIDPDAALRASLRGLVERVGPPSEPA
ncbi:MAG: MazG family protein [Lapillicoccus sp.]